MDMSVAPVMDHRKVEDCPASTVEGSAVKLLITGAAAVGGGGGCCVGGGGGGGGGSFFPHPRPNNPSADNSNSIPPRHECNDACNLELSLILKSPLLVSLVFRFYCVALLQTGFSLFPCVVSCCTSP